MRGKVKRIDTVRMVWRAYGEGFDGSFLDDGRRTMIAWIKRIVKRVRPIRRDQTLLRPVSSEPKDLEEEGRGDGRSEGFLKDKRFATSQR